MGAPGNPYHDPKSGEFTSAEGAGSGGEKSHANVPPAHGEAVKSEQVAKLPYGGKAGQNYPYAHLSSTALKGSYDKHLKKESATASEFISSGRGYEKPSETRTKTDPLSQRANAESEVHNHLVDEMRRRESYSGSLKPIPESQRQSFAAVGRGRY